MWLGGHAIRYEKRDHFQGRTQKMWLGGHAIRYEKRDHFQGRMQKMWLGGHAIRYEKRDHFQGRMQKMWLGGQTRSLQNVRGQKCTQCINFTKVYRARAHLGGGMPHPP